MKIFNENAKLIAFWRILKKQDPVIQYTIKYEEFNKSINFLTINITSTINDKYNLKVHRKDAITNIYLIISFCISSYTIRIIV